MLAALAFTRQAMFSLDIANVVLYCLRTNGVKRGLPSTVLNDSATSDQNMSCSVHELSGTSSAMTF